MPVVIFLSFLLGFTFVAHYILDRSGVSALLFFPVKGSRIFYKPSLVGLLSFAVHPSLDNRVITLTPPPSVTLAK